VRGCALSALWSLLGLATVVAAIIGGLHQRYGTAPSDAVGVALLAGVFGWVMLGLLYSAVKAWRERSVLVAAMAGRAPVDGRQAVLVGQMEPIGLPLRAPFSGAECVAYSFEIFQMRRSGKTTHKAVYYDGVAVVPSMIVTRGGSYRLLAVPDLDCDETYVPRETALRLAGDYVRSTTFESAAKSFSRPALERQWSDDDGSYRREVRRTADEVDLAACTLSQRQIERGASVCVFGPYSASKRAIVADPNDWSKITRIMKGDADLVVRQLRSSVARRIAGALLCGGAAAGLIAAFVASTA
jgi:hypothetical protein